MPVKIANFISFPLRGGVRYWVIPRLPVDELLNDALAVLGETFVIETEDGNRGLGFGLIVDCLNLTINLESKDQFASRMKWRHEFGTVVLPPTTLKLCAIAILCLHTV